MIAAPQTTIDPVFKRSVIFITGSDALKVYGHIINKPTQLITCEQFPDFREITTPIYWGGHHDWEVHFIHTLEELHKCSHHISHGIYYGGDTDFIGMHSRKRNSRNIIRLFAGQCIWNEFDLREEIAGGKWIIIPGSHAMRTVLFNSPEESWDDLWLKCIANVDKMLALTAELDLEHKQN